MGCGACGKKTADRGTPAPVSRSIGPDGPPPGMVEIVYGGTIGNHFVFSPTRRVNGQRHRYGYYSRGDIFYVLAEDVQARPDLFAPVISGEVAEQPSAEQPAPEAEAEPADDVMWADDVVEVERAFPPVVPPDDFTTLPWVGEEQALFFLEELKVLTFAELAALPVSKIQKAPGLGKVRAAEVKDAAARA